MIFNNVFIFGSLNFPWSLWACLTFNQTKNAHPVCFIVCLHLRLVQSTCGSYAWGPKEIGCFYAKMLAKSSIKLLFIPQVTWHFAHHDHQNHIAIGDFFLAFIFNFTYNDTVRHFTSTAGSIAFRNVTSVMVSTGRTCHWKPHGGTQRDREEAHPLIGAMKTTFPCSEYQAWGKMRYCLIPAMFST